MEVRTSPGKVERIEKESIPPAPPQTGQPEVALEPAPQEQISRWDGLALKVWVLCFLILVGCHLVELVRHLLWGE